MKLSEIKVDTEYAVLPQYQDVKGCFNDINTIANTRVMNATVVSLDVYEYDPSNRNPDPAHFKLAVPQKKKSGRALLVKSKDMYSDDVYYHTVQLKQILVEWSVLIPIWNESKRLEEERKAKAEAERKVLEDKKTRARAHAERAQHSLPKTVKSLVGARCGDVTVEFQSYSNDPNATITMRLTDFEILLEQLYEKKEEVA
jgi:hypothetical protein